MEKTLTTKMPLAQPPSKLVHIRRAQSDSEADCRHPHQERDPGLSHTSPPIPAPSSAGVSGDNAEEDLNSNNEIDVLALIRYHYLPDGTAQYPDSKTIEALKSAYHRPHTTHEEQRVGEIPKEPAQFHSVPSPQCPEEEVLDGSTIEVSPSTEEGLLSMEPTPSPSAVPLVEEVSASTSTPIQTTMMTTTMISPSHSTGSPMDML